MKLTKTNVTRAKYDPSSAKIQRIWDDKVSGLGLELFKTGKKSFIFRYRINGKQKFLTIGHVGDINLDEARDIAHLHRVGLREGIDPKSPTRSEEAMTVKQLIDDYTSSGYYKSLSQDFHYNFSTTARKYISPPLGDSLVTAIKPWQCSALIEDLIKAGKAGSAKGLKTMLTNLFKHAQMRHVIEFSPMLNVHVQFPKKAHKEKQWLSADEDLKEAWYMDAPLQVRAIVRWCLLTGCRRDEARLSNWETIEGGVWTVQDTKMAKPLSLPLMPLMQSVLDEVRPVFAHSDWIFPATTKMGKPIPRGTLDYILRESVKIGWGMHVLRHTVESWLAELGIDEESRDMVLNHSRASVGSRYNHSQQLQKKRDALEVWHAKLSSVIG